MATAGGSAVNFNRDAPVIDYTSLDWSAIRADLITYAQNTYSDRWTDFNPTQFAVVFLDLIAYFMDLVTFYLNAGLREMTIPTAQRRSHLLVLARAYAYKLSSASPASAAVSVTSNPGLLPYLMPAATTKFGAGAIVFQPTGDTTITTTPQAVSVIEGEQFQSVALGTSAGTQNQQFSVPKAPVIDGSLIVYVSSVAWAQLDTLTNSAPGDTVFRTTTDDEGNVTIIFGDGVNGKIPPVSQAVAASYTIGGGAQGRVGAGTIVTLISVPAGTQSVTNPSAATGGNDQETLEQARASVPASLSAGDRAVTLDDYAIVALKASSSVEKTVAIQADSRTVRLVIAPAGGGVATDALKSTVLAYVAARRQVGHRIKAADPFYVPLAANIDLFVTQSAKASDIAIAAKALFLTANATDQQNGLLDFDNVGFGARDDNSDPQLTVSLVDAVIAKLKPRGLQTSRINQLTTKPSLKPFGFTNSTNAALTFIPTATSLEELVRRRWRIQFVTPTTYLVWEGIIGNSTQLTRSVLTDDRALFPNISTLVATLNPNTDQSATLAINEALCTGQTITLQNATDDLYAYSVPGDRYRIEWPATPTGGTVGVPFTPTKVGGTVHGFAWTLTGTGFSGGDQYWVDVFGNVDDILLDNDELPTLDPSNLTINIRNAY